MSKPRSPISDIGFRIIFTVGALALIALRSLQPQWLPADAVTVSLLVAALLPWVASFLQSAKLPGGWEFVFRELRAKVEQQEKTIEQQQLVIDEFSEQYLRLERDYLTLCREFHADAPSSELDELATQLKSFAGGLRDLKFLEEHLRPDTPPGYVFGLACALQVRPQGEYLDPLVLYLEQVVSDPQLSGQRLKTLYRLVMSVENILRVDNKRPDQNISDEQRARIAAMLLKMSEHSYVQEDHTRTKARSLASRAQRVLRVVKRDGTARLPSLTDE